MFKRLIHQCSSLTLILIGVFKYLHDIGYLPLFTFFANQDKSFFDDPAIQLDLQEMHVEVGVLLMMFWNFTPDLVRVIEKHEDIDKEFPKIELAQIVCCANDLTKIKGFIKQSEQFNTLTSNQIKLLKVISLTLESSDSDYVLIKSLE